MGSWSDGRNVTVDVGVWAPYQPDVVSGECVYIGDPWDDRDQYNRWYMTSCNHVMSSVCERTPCPSGKFDFKGNWAYGNKTVHDWHNKLHIKLL